MTCPQDLYVTFRDTFKCSLTKTTPYFLNDFQTGDDVPFGTVGIMGPYCGKIMLGFDAIQQDYAMHTSFPILSPYADAPDIADITSENMLTLTQPGRMHRSVAHVLHTMEWTRAALIVSDHTLKYGEAIRLEMLALGIHLAPTNQPIVYARSSDALAIVRMLKENDVRIVIAMAPPHVISHLLCAAYTTGWTLRQGVSWTMNTFRVDEFYKMNGLYCSDEEMSDALYGALGVTGASIDPLTMPDYEMESGQTPLQWLTTQQSIDARVRKGGDGVCAVSLSDTSNVAD
jgi:hypothetical protein